MKNKKTVIIAIVIILAIAVIAGVIFIINKNAPKPEETLSAYISLLNDQKYEEMYNMISENSKTQISQEDFIKRNKNIYEGIDAYDIKVTPSETTKDGKTYSIKYDESMSTSANVMRIAAEELEAEKLVTVIDSANLSTGIGLLVIEAATMAQNGKNAQDIVKKIEELKPFVRASFVVDTLTYLYRGGRCSGLAAMAGGALKLHPKIVVEDGAMNPAKKYRGKMKKVLMDYVKDMEKELKQAKKDRVFITHSGCDQDIIREIYQHLDSLNIFSEILVTRAGGVISSHCGPGTLGVLFISKV